MDLGRSSLIAANRLIRAEMSRWKPARGSARMAEERPVVTTIPIQQAVAQLIDLVRDLGPGDEIVLTDGDRHLARIVPEIGSPSVRRPGACKGMLDVLSDGDEVILEHFKEYMP